MYEIYSKPNCDFCVKAKTLLESKGLEYAELIIDIGQTKEEGLTYATVAQLKQRVPNARTVPQIFHNGKLIGGFDALKLSLN